MLLPGIESGLSLTSTQLVPVESIARRVSMDCISYQDEMIPELDDALRAELQPDLNSYRSQVTD